MKLIGAGFRDVVDLRGAVAPLIHRIGNRVDRHLRDRIQPQDQICGKATSQIGRRIVGLLAIDNSRSKGRASR